MLSYNSTFYGAVGLYYLDKELHKAEIGFWLIPDYWRKGIISESVLLALQYGFQKMDLRRIEAEIETENIRSINLLKKLHFVYVGTKKDCEIKYGMHISVDLYAIQC